MQTLNRAAGFDPPRQNTQANVEELCAKITTHTPAPIFLLGSANPLGATVADAIYSYTTKARQLNRDILSLSTYLSSDLIDLIALIEDHGELDRFEFIYTAYRQGHTGKDDNLSGIAPVLFNYLQIVDHVATYRNSIRVAAYKAPPYLLGAGHIKSDATPLEAEM